MFRFSGFTGTLALVASAVLLPFASTAHAAVFCDLADQMTQEKIDAECKAQFVGEMKNPQDKVDFERALTLWKAPPGIEITRAANSVYINVPGTDPLQIGFISDEPLVIMINNKIYLDQTKEPSWSRRFEKIFAQAAKDQVAVHRTLPSWFMIERADAAWGDLPPAPKLQAGYTFAVYAGNASTPVKGSAADVLATVNDSEKTPDYSSGNYFSRAIHNMNPWGEGKNKNITSNDYTCSDNGLKQGSYRIKGLGGEDRGVVARSLGNNEIAIKGIYNDGTEIKVKMIPQGPDGNLCSDKFKRGGNCSKSWAAYKASDPTVRKAINKASAGRRGHRAKSPNCKMMGDREAECIAFLSQAKLSPQQQVISDDEKLANKNNVVSICKPDTDCKEATGRPNNRDLYNAFDPGGRAQLKAAKTAEVASESLTNKEIYINHLLSAGLDESKANGLCKTSRRGRETCNLPSKKALGAAGFDMSEYDQLVSEQKAMNSATQTRTVAEANVPKDVSTKADENGNKLRHRVQEIAVSMLMYGTMCKDPEGQKQLQHWHGLGGSNFKKEDGSSGSAPTAQ